MFKKVVSLMLLFSTLSIPSYAISDKSLTVVYTADVLGEDKPRHL